jgi:hypothetical protein
MSSLDSYLSFDDDSKESHVSVEIEIEFDAEALARPPLTKKRSKPRLYGNRRTTTGNDSTHSTPSSRWAVVGSNKSSQSSPAPPQRSSRPLQAGKSRPTLDGTMAQSLDGNSSHSVNSLKIMSLLSAHGGGGTSRWSADNSSAHNSNICSSASFGHGSLGSSMGGRRTGTAAGSGSESASRWSASFSSSQMEQLSTRPRFPRRKRSDLAAASRDSYFNNDDKNNNYSNIGSMLAASGHMTETTAADTSSWATEFATVGSSDMMEQDQFSMESDDTSRIFVLDCSILQQQQQEETQTLLPTTTSYLPPPPKSTTKPRSQLPRRQRSNGRGVTLDMVAKAAMKNKRAEFIKQKSESSLKHKSERSLFEGTACDLTAISIATSIGYEREEDVHEDPPTVTLRTRRQRNFRRIMSMPHQLDREHIASAGGQGSPLLPERQASDADTLFASLCRSTDLQVQTPLAKERTMMPVHHNTQRDSPHLPQRMPSETFSRASFIHGYSNDDLDEEGSFQQSGNHTDLLNRMQCSTLMDIPGPPVLPQRRISGDYSISTAGGGSARSKKNKTSVLQTSLTTIPDSAATIPNPFHGCSHGCSNRRLFMTKHRSEPSGLSLTSVLVPHALSNHNVGGASWESILYLTERPTKRRQTLSKSWSYDDQHDVGVAALEARERFFSPMEKQYWSSPELMELMVPSSSQRA